ncbi:metallophosphoesterase [Indiicoccus explosivorum]|uniref:metallophosphoesterase n=1 Tax=Indiicoccus explosivorum TaxID=1917864 RepID=UPI000B4483DF|nr:metallophosphoesterase [Indiicoccus explosivorum]
MLKPLMAATAAGGAGLLSAMFWNAHHAKQKNELIELHTQQPFEPFRMLFISDIHRRKLRPGFIEGHPDFIVIGGDLAESGVPPKRIRHNLQVLSALAPVYFIWGNNDRELRERKLRRLFSDTGTVILENGSVSPFADQRVKLVAFDYFAFHKNGLLKAFDGIKEEDTVIFLSHTPEVFNHVQRNYHVHMMIGGHTHGGQIRLGKYGLYERGRTEVKDGVVRLVSNGYGTTKLPLRLGAEAEFHLLTIRPARS